MAFRKLISLRHFPCVSDLSKVVFVRNSRCMYSSLTTLNTPQIRREVSVKPANETFSEDLPKWDMENPFIRPKQQCILCRMNITPDYKNVKLLSQFVSRFTGRIYGRHITRLCKSKQASVEREIHKAQSAGLMAYYFRDLHFTDDPKLFNPEKPARPHRF